MQFLLKATITEDDYFNFNIFHNIESSQAKKAIFKHHIIFIACMAVIIATFLIVLGFTAYSVACTTLMALLAALYLIFFNKMIKQNIRKTIQKFRKDGKYPFDEQTTSEFYDDKFVDFTPTRRTELGYSEVKKVCILGDRYIILYTTDLTANILPSAQIRDQINYDDFLRFLCSKCSTVENYD